MKLPPLNAVHAFEVAARTGSFVAASSELGVSSAAVSMQVRNLEKWLGKRLFTRTNNRIALTDAGRSIYPGIANALGSVAQLTGDLLEPGRRTRIVVSVLPSLAERWLAPRLAEFCRAEPDAAIQLRIEGDPVDFAAHNIALRITFGAAQYPEFRSLVLFEEAVTPLIAPALAAAAEPDGGIGRIGDDALIHDDWGPDYASAPLWSAWFAKAGFPRRPDMARGMRVTTTSASIALAARGMGVALAPRSLAAAEIAAGALIAPSPVSLPLAQPYCAVFPHARQNEAWIARLLPWLST